MTLTRAALQMVDVLRDVPVKSEGRRVSLTSRDRERVRAAYEALCDALRDDILALEKHRQVKALRA